MHIRWTREHYDEMQELMTGGKSETGAAREIGIPKGSVGYLKKRFGTKPSPHRVSEDYPIGGLALELHDYTSALLKLATHLGQLDAKQDEAAGLRRRMEEAERQLIARASVVHNND